MNEVVPQDPVPVAVFVALDWADKKHAGMLSTDGQTSERFELEQTPEAIDLWVAGLRKRFPEARVAVALEQSKRALVYALLKYDLFVLYPVNPKQLARFREAAPSGAKDDPGDAALLLELLIKHRDRLRPWRPDDPTTRLIGQLAEDRRHLVENRTRLVNALKSRLKQYFPLALEVLGEAIRNWLANSCCVGEVSRSFSRNGAKRSPSFITPGNVIIRSSSTNGWKRLLPPPRWSPTPRSFRADR